MAADAFTVAGFFAHFIEKMAERLKGSGVGQFRRIAMGAVSTMDYDRPFIGVEVLNYKDVRLRDGDPVKAVKMKLRVPFDYQAGEGPLKAMQITVPIDNFLDNYTPPQGVSKIEEREWSLSTPSGDASGLTGFVDGVITVNVIVGKGQN